MIYISDLINTEALKIGVMTEAEDRLKSIYLNHIGEDFNIFIVETFRESMSELVDYGEVNEIASLNLINRIQRTKARWTKKELQQGSSMYNEINVIAQGLFDLSPEKFKLAYGLDRVEELVIKRREEFEAWSNNKNSLITDFAYIDSKAKFQVKTALKNDFKLIFLSNIIDSNENNKKVKITRVPKSMSKIPYDSTNRASLKLQKIEANGEIPAYYVDKYKINDTTVFESIIDAETLKNHFAMGIVKALNENDFAILISLLSFIDNDFYSSREILVSTRDLTISAFGESSYSGERRNIVKDSLFKMQYLNTGIVDPLNRGFTFKIIDNVNIIVPKDTDIELISVVFNRDIVKQIVDNNTINMYSDIINNFKLSTSRILMVHLELERIALAEEIPLIKHLSFDFFRKALYFTSNNRYRNIKRVETALIELVESKVTIKSFKRKGSNFIVEFYPVSDKERKDLFNNPATPLYFENSKIVQDTVI